MTYFEFTQRFPDENSAIDLIVAAKYKDGYVCPKCGCVHRVYRQNYNRRFLYCNNCKSEFSALKGTIFERTHLDLRMWLYVINLVNVSRKLQREMGMGSYHSAWHMLHQIRKAMKNEEYKETFEAIVEIDETYVGGKPRKENRHDESDKNDGDKPERGRGTSKTPVIGVKEHNTVAYSLGDGIHTNGIESFWAVLKRGVYGIFHNGSIKYMQRAYGRRKLQRPVVRMKKVV